MVGFRQMEATCAGTDNPLCEMAGFVCFSYCGGAFGTYFALSRQIQQILHANKYISKYYIQIYISKYYTQYI